MKTLNPKLLIKKIPFVLMVFLFVGFLISPKLTHAADPTGTCIDAKGIQTENLTSDQCPTPPNAGWFVSKTDATANKTAQDAAAVAQNKEKTDQCFTLTGGFNILSCVTTALGVVAITALQIFSLFTMLAGTALNFVVNYTIVDMAEHYRNISGIKESWTTIRDLANMGFIFVLLFAAIKTVIGEGKDTKKLIVNMIIAALLMNFSFFFTSLVIDASNLVALTFYKAIVPNYVANDVLNAGLSNSIMQPLGLPGLWKLSSSGALSGTNLITIGIMGSVLTLIAAFVFAAIALMFIIRYVILIFVLILSPIFVVGSIIPGMDDYAKQWKSALLGQAFFAPVYMIITWVVVKIFTSDNFLIAKGSLADVLNDPNRTAGSLTAGASGADNIGLIVNFIVIIAFLVATILISKKISDKSVSFASSMNKWAMGKAGGATFGTVGRFGRNTLGSMAADDLKNENLKERARSGDMGARLRLATADKVSKGSFDFRGTAAGGELDAGKAEKGGFAADQKAREKIYGSYKPKDDKATKEAEEAAQKAEEAHNKAIKQAERSFNESGVSKSSEYIAAEEALKAEMAKPELLRDEAVMNGANQKIAEEKQKHTEKVSQAKVAHIEKQTESERIAKEATAQTKKDTISQMEKAARIQEGYLVNGAGQYVDRNGKRVEDDKKMKTWERSFGSFVVGGKNKAAAFRSAGKEKTEEQKLAEAAANIAKKKEEKPATEEPKKDGGGTA